eukprot:12447-Rhodomonas_salina.2
MGRDMSGTHIRARYAVSGTSYACLMAQQEREGCTRGKPRTIPGRRRPTTYGSCLRVPSYVAELTMLYGLVPRSYAAEP